MRRTGIFGALLFTLTVSAAANAGQLIDQQQTTFNTAGSGYLYQGLSGVGQLFSPTLTGIDFVKVYLATAGTTVPNISLNLYDASSPFSLLGQTNQLTIAANQGVPGSSGVWVEFDFSSRISLLAGHQYTFIFNNATLPATSTADTLYGFGTNVASTYSGGSAVVDSAPAVGFQSDFQEGINNPEPATLILGAIGMLCCGGSSLLRRRRTQA